MHDQSDWIWAASTAQESDFAGFARVKAALNRLLPSGSPWTRAAPCGDVSPQIGHGKRAPRCPLFSTHFPLWQASAVKIVENQLMCQDEPSLPADVCRFSSLAVRRCPPDRRDQIGPREFHTARPGTSNRGNTRNISRARRGHRCRQCTSRRRAPVRSAFRAFGHANHPAHL